MALMNDQGTKRTGLDVPLFPGLSQQVAESKSVRLAEADQQCRVDNAFRRIVIGGVGDEGNRRGVGRW